MGLFGRTMDAISAAAGAFRGSLMMSSAAGGQANRGYGWDDWPGRSTRYAIWWALYEGTAFGPEHPWSRSFKWQRGLSRNIRPIANPCKRIVDFYVSHLLGGPLDPAAGDGAKVASCLPIVLGPSARERFRPALSQLWRDSRMAEVKDRAGLYGAALGNFGFRVVNDPGRGRVRLEVVHPGEIAHLDLDPTGTVSRGYDIRRWIADPRVPPGDPSKPTEKVEARETAVLVGESVVYSTYLAGKPYPLNGVAPTWAAPYGFVPFFLAKHHDIGSPWAFNSFHQLMPRILEGDNQASVLSDQICKALRPPYFFSGVDPQTFFRPGEGTGDPRPRRANWEGFDPRAGQDEVDSLATPDEHARAVALHMRIDIAGARQHIDGLSADLIRDLPELRTDPGGMGGTVTAEAIRAAQAESTTRVLARRAGYFAPLERAQMAAVAIGGHWKYPGYEGFDLDSFADGHLDHTIGEYPVFATSEADRLAFSAQQSTIVEALARSGVGLGDALLMAGVREDVVARIVANRAIDAATIAAGAP